MIRWLHFGLLAVVWCLVAAIALFLSLEATRDEALADLQQQIARQASLIERQMQLLEQQLAVIGRTPQALEARQIESWIPAILLHRFPVLERVAILDISQQTLLIDRIVPLRLAGDILPQQDLSGQDRHSGATMALHQGQQYLQDASLLPDETRLLWFYPLHGNKAALGLWFYPQRWLEPLSERGSRLTLQIGWQVGEAYELRGWPSEPLRVTSSILIVGQRYQLVMERRLQFADFDLLRWIPLTLFLLLLPFLLWQAAIMSRMAEVRE